MKRGTLFSIAVGVIFAVTLLINARLSVEGQNQVRYVAGTGVIAISPDEKLSLSVDTGAGDDAIAIRFRRTIYVMTNCTDGVCRYVVESQTTTPAMISAPNQSSKLDLMGNQIGTDRAVSIEVLSSSRNAVVTMLVSDPISGKTTVVDRPILSAD